MDSTKMNGLDVVCVVSRTKDGIGYQVYDGSRNPKIRTYLAGQVDGRWDGPLLTSAGEVFAFLGDHEHEPCSVPVELARKLFNPTIPFAEAPPDIRNFGSIKVARHDNAAELPSEC